MFLFCNNKRKRRLLWLKLIGIVYILLFFYILFNLNKFESQNNESKTSNDFKAHKSNDILTTLLVRIDRAISFFEQDLKNVNLDGLYGIRYAQGTFIGIISNAKHYDASKASSTYKFVKIFQLLEKRIEDLSRSIMLNVKQKDERYFDNFMILIDRPFVWRPQSTISADHSIVINSKIYESSLIQNEIKNFNEKSSDSCFTHLLGGISNNNECRATNEECLNIFLNSESTGYYLTHQFLYFYMGEHVILLYYKFKKSTLFLFDIS
jgi:hypothetical protein